MIELISYTNLENELGDCYCQIDFSYNDELLEITEWGSVDSDEHAIEIIKQHLEID